MFLGFGKKNSTNKKSGPAVESPKTVSSPGLNSTGDGLNGSLRSTVQTTAGPLLSSTRYNSILDASTFANVSSPGFTSRVVNCASNGSSYHENTSTHQSKYSTVGLFPRVQLGEKLPLPVLSPHNSQKVSRTAVRVRIASPSICERRRHSICIGSTGASQEKFQSLKRSPSLNQQSLNSNATPTKCPETASAVDSIQEASRKRIFSECQDSSQDEIKKRRRKAESPIPNPNNDVYHYRHVRAPAVPASPPQSDVTSQGKRAREKGSPEEQKRQRRKVCNTNNAISSSLSSSRNLLERLTAQKRKSVDTSRSSSPLTPFSGKHVKESRTVTDTEVTQRKLNNVSPINEVSAGEIQNNTPIFSKANLKRPDSGERKSHKDESKGSLNCSPQTPCDYTTKLFRKDVSLHSPRTPASKSLKQSLWIQPPEADELSCSLLDDDSKLDRPERLKSLLARVSGKDKKLEGNKTITPTSAAIESHIRTSTSSISGISLPTSTPPKAPSSSSALTVTVSSTCTVMTSATVTSVNGVPSSESSCLPPPPASSSSSLILSSQSFTSRTSETNVGITPQSSTTNVGQLTASLTVQAPTRTLSMPTIGTLPSTGLTSSSTVFTMNSPSSSRTPQTENSAYNAAQTPKSSFQFGAGGNNTSVAAKPSFQFGSSTSTAMTAAIPSTTPLQSGSGSDSSPALKAAFQFSSSQPSITSASLSSIPGSNSSATPPSFSFGSTNNVLSVTSKPSLQFTTKTSNSDITASAKPTFSFGASANVASEAPKPALQFGSGGSSLGEPAKPAFQFASSGQGASGSLEVPKSSFQFGFNGSSTPEAAKSTVMFGASQTPAPSFGSSSSGSLGAPKSAFQFGSSNSTGSEAPKSTFQFNSSNTSQVSKPAVSFGSTNSGMAASSKESFQFGPSSSDPSGTTKPVFQFSTNNSSATSVTQPSQFMLNGNGAAEATKTSFQFGSSMKKPLDSSKPAFQFSSNSEKPSFESSTQGSSSAFSQVPQQQTTSTFAFGSAAQSGAENQSSFTFGSSGPAFSSTSSGSTSFGSGQNSSGFGAPSTNMLSTQPSFGSATDPKSGSFGSSSSFGSTGSNSFSFNSNGASAAAGSFQGPAAGSSGTFSFGQKQDQPPSAFSFNATVGAVPNSSAQPSAPGFFSVGAGASSGQRRVRDARRRR